MVRVQIDQLLQQKGKTVYWLSKTTGISNNNLASLIKNDTVGIRFDSLERICEALECSISDVLEILPDENT